MRSTILVVEDEEAIMRLLQFELELKGFTVICAESAEEARILIDDKLPDVVLLDWMLPKMSGVEFAKELRNTPRTKELPIIMLTARGEEEDTELGLNIGADDYITKPFSKKELVARIKALLRRRAPQKSDSTVQVGKLTLNPAERLVLADEKVIAFGPTEFKLLHFFMTHTDRIYSRRELLDLVWGDHVFIEERTVDVHIRRLRKELESVGLERYIETVRGVGYCFGDKR